MKKNPPFLLNLPSEIATDILSRLPVRTIVLCKCVCKELRDILSSLEFAKSHLSRSTPGLIVNVTLMKEPVYNIVEFERVPGLRSHDIHCKLVMKFNPAELLHSLGRNIIMRDSINGLLFLQTYPTQLDDAFYICNPITREYISLGNVPPRIFANGFGVSKVSGQYKVVQIQSVGYKVTVAVYTLGTGSWRTIEHDEPYKYDFCTSSGVFLNGNLHWLVKDTKGTTLISCFDLETELFQHFSPPHSRDTFASLAVLGDNLLLNDYQSDKVTVVWIMKEYGVKESWTKEFYMSIYNHVLPLKAFKDDDILYVWRHSCLWYYCNKTELTSEVDFFERDGHSRLQAMLHTSSFLSFKNFAMENVISF